MIHAKNISITEKEKGYEVRFEIGFDKAIGKKEKDRLGAAFPKVKIIAFGLQADQSEIENKIKIEIGRLDKTFMGFDPKAKNDQKLNDLNSYFDGKIIK